MMMIWPRRGAGDMDYLDHRVRANRYDTHRFRQPIFFAIDNHATTEPEHRGHNDANQQHPSHNPFSRTSDTSIVSCP